MTLASERGAVQNPFLRSAQEAGWTYLAPDDALSLRPGPTSPILLPVLVQQLPHLNPGVLTGGELDALRSVAPSMGIMLESVADRLCGPGQPHHGSPDKEPARRLAMLEAAGERRIAFTTGLLIGIGETWEERVDTLLAIRASHERWGHIQEVIVQNFRAKPDTKMRDTHDAELDDLAATIAVTRLVLGSKARIQAPPNLVGAQYDLILRAGIDDWGGVSPLTPDHVNPERPWPQVQELAERTRAAGFDLHERLTIYPGYLREPWLDPRLAGHVARLADPATGLAVYDSYGTTATGWGIFGGTSLASPLAAGITALAGGSGTTVGAQMFYGASSLNDVVSGTDSLTPCTPSYLCNAGPGYDAPTGNGRHLFNRCLNRLLTVRWYHDYG